MMEGNEVMEGKAEMEGMGKDLGYMVGMHMHDSLVQIGIHKEVLVATIGTLFLAAAQTMQERVPISEC